MYDAKSTVAMAMQVADVSAASVMHRAKEPTTTFIKPPEVDSRQKKNSYPQPVELSSLSKPMGSLSQTSLLNGRRSGVCECARNGEEQKGREVCEWRGWEWVGRGGSEMMRSEGEGQVRR